MRKRLPVRVCMLSVSVSKQSEDQTTCVLTCCRHYYSRHVKIFS